MSSYSNEPEERRHVSKVTFSSISSDVLVVKIRKVSSEVREEDIPRMSNAFRPASIELDDQSGKGNHPQLGMADSQKATPTSQTGCKHTTSSAPCLKHAAENISRKAIDIPSEKISLCNNCSKSMLSYIFVVQDFLDSLAKEISGSDTTQCLQCARQEVRNSIAALSTEEKELPSRESSRVHTQSKEKVVPDNRLDGKRHSTPTAKSQRQERKRNDDYQKDIANTSGQGPPAYQHRQEVPIVYDAQDKSIPSHIVQGEISQNLPNKVAENPIIPEHAGSDNQHSIERGSSKNPQNFNQQWTATDNQSINQKVGDTHQVIHEPSKAIKTNKDDSISHSYSSSCSNTQQTNGQLPEKPFFRPPMERMQPNYEENVVVPQGQNDQNPIRPNDTPTQSPTVFRDGVDGIVSTLSNMEREIYDSARDRAGWEGLAEPLERLGMPSQNVVASEAFVTSCRNNAEAIGCLVVGTSLLLTRTTRTLCVLVSDGVSTAFRGALSSVFQVVQYVKSLDSLGTTKLALLEEPELGITFEKLNIWRLVQFTKCVYLNPDTLVIQNCDELFCREELSAVPDIGWPDCFNSGVFVFSPSNHNFWQLLEFAEKRGSYDGGDQGLLNSYFTSWSSDITKKLSFIYNLMANVSYTYTPAFKKFGRDVKIVQFHGSFKPWHVKFFPNSGQISPSSPVHPTYVQFVHIWINIFRISVLRLMPQEIQSYAASQETICAVEILRFFPLPSESESEFFLTPPSVRVRLAEIKLNRSISLPISEARRRKSAEFLRHRSPDDMEVSMSCTEANQKIEVIESSVSTTGDQEKEVGSTSAVSITGDEEKEVGAASTTGDDGKENLATSACDADEVFERTPEKVKGKNAMPGAEVGDYQGMKAWEQGRMDYQGTDSSDNVIKRLEFLISKP